MWFRSPSALIPLLALSLLACGGSGDGEPVDAGVDAAVDTGPGDSGPTDAGPADSGLPDAADDSGAADAGALDAAQ